MSSSITDKTVYSVSIEAKIQSASSAVRFPCLFSVQWRTNNHKVSLETAKYTPQGGKTDFNESLIIKTQIAYDRIKKIFLKKETQVQLNLVSKSRADQPKLVGRVTIDLATILNQRVYEQPTEFALQFCSVNASLLMSFKVLEKIETDLSCSQLQLSIGDSLSLNSALKLANNSSIKERYSQMGAPDSGSASKSKEEIQEAMRLQISPIYSPINIDNTAKRNSIGTKSVATTIKDIRQVADSKTESSKFAVKSAINTTSMVDSAVTSKKSETGSDVMINGEAKEESKRYPFKKVGSIISSEQGKNSDIGRMSEDFSKTKIEIEKMKIEGQKCKQESQGQKLQSERLKQQNQLLKVELKQKKITIDQSSFEISSLKSELIKMRQQMLKQREQSVNLSLKNAQLKQAQNKTSVHISKFQRQISKLEGINEKYNQLSLQKSKLLQNEKLSAKILKQQQQKISCLQQQLSDLKKTLNSLDQMHQQAINKCSQHQSNLYQNKGSFEYQILKLKQQLQQQTNEKILYQQEVNNLNGEINNLSQEIERLIALSHQNEQAKHSWEITSNLMKDDIDRFNDKNRQLQERYMNSLERIRWLQGQNQLLSENSRNNREEYFKLKQEKNNIQNQTNNQLTTLKQSQQTLYNERQQLSTKLSAIQTQYSNLLSDYNQLIKQYQLRCQNEMKLQATSSQLSLKHNELQQLVINLNQLRDKDHIENSNKQREFIVKIAQLQGNIEGMNQLVDLSQKRINAVQEQLKGRENLIYRLQQGLKKQVQGSQELSKRVMYHIERQQRMKENMVILEIQARKIGEMLIEQENKEAQNMLRIGQKEGNILELSAQLQSGLQYSKKLQESIRKLQLSSNQSISTLKKQLNLKSQQLNDSIASINTMTNKIHQIQSKNRTLQLSLQSQTKKYSSEIEILRRQIDVLSNNSEGNASLALQKQRRIIELEAEYSRVSVEGENMKSQMQAQMIEYDKLGQLIKQNEIRHQQEIRILQEKRLQLQTRLQQIQNQLTSKQKQFQQQIVQYQIQVQTISQKFQSVSSQFSALNINAYTQQIKRQQQEILRLQKQLQKSIAENNKIPNLQRSLKIKSIQLSSMKGKGKIDGLDGNQLLKLKDEQIGELRVQIDRLMRRQEELLTHSQKCQALATELELMEQEKFNIQSLSNEKTLQLQEIKEQNKNLMEEITIIGERNGQLEKTLQQIMSKQTGKSMPNINTLKAENAILKGQLKQLQALQGKISQLQKSKKKLQDQLENKDERHMLALIDQQIQLTKSDQNSKNADLVKKSSKLIKKETSNPTLDNIYKFLRELLDSRAKSQNNRQINIIIQNSLAAAEYDKGFFIEKSRNLSKQFLKLKTQILKTEGRGGQDKIKIMGIFKVFESQLAQMVKQAEQGKK